MEMRCELAEHEEEEEEEEEEEMERNRGGRKQVKIGTTRRNARERNRVKHINDCFEILRQHIPHQKHNKKLSKVDTLKSAMIYIQNLKQLLQSSSSPQCFYQEQQRQPQQQQFFNLKEENLFYSEEHCNENPTEYFN